MRIGIDYGPAVSHPPGVGRYVRELVRALVQLEDRPDLGLLDVGRSARAVDERALGLTIGDPQIVRVRRDVPRALVRIGHALLGRGADRWLGGVDVFHHARLGTHALPVGRARQTVAIAELPPPGSPAESMLRTELRRMDLVFVFSRAYRTALVQRFALDPVRVIETHVGCEHWRRSLAALPPPGTGGSLSPRIVVLGGLRASRRPLAVLRAFERLVEGGLDAHLEFLTPPMARASAPDPCVAQLSEALRASKVADRVAWKPGRALNGPALEHALVALERELPRKISEAAVLVHLSSDEGTPVTPLEALCVGVPVVVSRIPAFEEALAGVAEFVDDDECVREPDVLAGVIRRAIATRHDGLSAARREVAARAFTWERCARETLAAWRGLG